MTDAPAAFRARDHTLPLGERTYVMAIINLTENSFSGDGSGTDLDAAIRHAMKAIAEGADILDIGAESARADVPARDADEEAQFVGEAIRRLADETRSIISVDTYKGVVATAALEAGAHIINDIGGFKVDTATAEAAAKHDAALVINYTYAPPKIRPSAPPRYHDLISEHVTFLSERVEVAVRLGVAPDALVIDPGIAFGKSHDEDLEVLRRLPEFRAIGCPLLVAASRKHFMGSVTGLPPIERDDVTVAVTALAIAGGTDIVRVHEVRGNVEAARIADAIVRGKPGEYAPTNDSWPWAAIAKPIDGTTIGSRQAGSG